MTQEARTKVYNKYNGHCAYCGKEIEYKDMQVDHIMPKTSKSFIETYQTDPNGFDEFVHTFMKNHICYIEHVKRLDSIDDLLNLMPTCRRCNHYKRSSTIEQYRSNILTILERLRKDYLFNVAEDYGIITPKDWDGTFYFERTKQ